MKRISLTNESFWFDADKAIVIKEETWWDGSNWISKATGSQWNHEGLYITKSGQLILNSWSQYQGSTETYEPISESQAAVWLIKNEIFEIDGEDINEKQKQTINALIADAEI